LLRQAVSVGDDAMRPEPLAFGRPRLLRRPIWLTLGAVESAKYAKIIREAGVRLE
jgi:hypothetical protein